MNWEMIVAIASTVIAVASLGLGVFNYRLQSKSRRDDHGARLDLAAFHGGSTGSLGTHVTCRIKNLGASTAKEIRAEALVHGVRYPSANPLPILAPNGECRVDFPLPRELMLRPGSDIELENPPFDVEVTFSDQFGPRAIRLACRSQR